MPLYRIDARTFSMTSIGEIPVEDQDEATLHAQVKSAVKSAFARGDLDKSGMNVGIPAITLVHVGDEPGLSGTKEIKGARLYDVDGDPVDGRHYRTKTQADSIILEVSKNGEKFDVYGAFMDEEAANAVGRFWKNGYL